DINGRYIVHPSPKYDRGKVHTFNKSLLVDWNHGRSISNLVQTGQEDAFTDLQTVGYNVVVLALATYGDRTTFYLIVVIEYIDKGFVLQVTRRYLRYLND